MKELKFLLFALITIAFSFNCLKCNEVDIEYDSDTYDYAQVRSVGDKSKNLKLDGNETVESRSAKVERAKPSETKKSKSENEKEVTTVYKEPHKIDNNTQNNVTGRSMSKGQANHMRQLLKQTNPFRSLLNTDIKWMGSMSDLRMETIAVPAALFRKAFWLRLSDEAKVPIDDMKKLFSVDFDNVKVSKGNYMVDITEEEPEGDYINLGELINFFIKHDINTRKFFICLGINPDVFTETFEDEIVKIVNQLFDLVKVPFKFGESYIEKMYHETADAAIKSLESYANLSPSNYIGKKAQIYSNEAAKIADRTAMEANKEIESFKESSSKLASGAFVSARSVLVLPAAKCSKKNPCKRDIDLSSLESIGSSVIDTYYSISPYAVHAYDTSMQIVHKLGEKMGPSSTAYADLSSKTMYVMTMDESTRIMKVPYVLFFADGTFMDRVLTMPQLLIDVGGDNYKPYLMIADPIVRYMRYLFTGEWDGSLNAGVDVDVDIAEKILGAQRPIEDRKTEKKQKRVERDTESKTGVEKEMQMVRDYEGKIPKGGYKHNIKSKGNHSNIVSRVLNAPSFLASAGGSLFSETSTALSPFMNSFEILLYSNDPYFVKIQNVQKELDSAPAYILPVASIVKAIYPTLDLIFGITYGEIGLVQLGLKLPMVVSGLGTVVFDLTYKYPVQMYKLVFQYERGDGGIMSMASLAQSSEFKPVDEGIIPSDVPEISGRSMSSSKTGRNKTRKGIINVYEPAASFVSQISSGLFGNILNPQKVNQSGLINFKNDPVTSFVKLMLNPVAMYNVATNKQVFLQIILGGLNPKKLLEIGINAERILENDIDPSRFLSGGLMMLPASKRKLFGSRDNTKVEHLQKLGFDEEKMKKVNLNYDRLLDDGLMSADEELLKKYDINPFLLINRLVRHSVINQYKFLNFGVDFKKFLCAGLRPDYLFATGVSSLEEKILKKYNVDVSSEQSLNNIGINTIKLFAKNISVEKFINSGLQDFTENEVKQKFGIHKKKLMKSMFAGLDNKTVVEIGVDIVKLTKSGFKPVNFILGIPQFLKLNETKLMENGIDKKKLIHAKIDFNALMKRGITSKVYTQFYRKGISLQYLTLSLLSTWGLDQLVADSDSSLSMTFNFATTSAKIASKPEVVSRSLNNVVNVSQFDPSGRYIQLLKSTMKKFTGEDTEEANTILLFNSYLKGNKNYKKLLNLGNSVRIIIGRENASDITNPFDHRPSTLQELNDLYADLSPPSQETEQIPEKKHRNEGFWG